MRQRRITRSRRPLVLYVPLLVTIAILLAWHFFRVSFLMSWRVPCSTAHEFWFVRNGDGWPLFASFALLLLLLISWNAAVWFDHEVRTRVDRTVLVLNTGALLSIVLVLTELIELAQVDFYKHQGGYESWNRTEEGLFLPVVSVCDAAKPYVGIWDVASVEVPFLGQAFPYRWIEFRGDLTFAASRSRFVDSIEGGWRPPDTAWQAPGQIWTEQLHGLWDFRLEGSRLTLVTPELMEVPISRVVLLRR